MIRTSYQFYPEAYFWISDVFCWACCLSLRLSRQRTTSLSSEHCNPGFFLKPASNQDFARQRITETQTALHLGLPCNSSQFVYLPRSHPFLAPMQFLWPCTLLFEFTYVNGNRLKKPDNTIHCFLLAHWTEMALYVVKNQQVPVQASTHSWGQEADRSAKFHRFMPIRRQPQIHRLAFSN